MCIIVGLLWPERYLLVEKVGEHPVNVSLTAGEDYSLADFAFQPAPAPVSGPTDDSGSADAATPVPTLSVYGLGLTVIGLMLAGARRLRKPLQRSK